MSPEVLVQTLGVELVEYFRALALRSRPAEESVIEKLRGHRDRKHRYLLPFASAKLPRTAFTNPDGSQNRRAGVSWLYAEPPSWPDSAHSWKAGAAVPVFDTSVTFGLTLLRSCAKNSFEIHRALVIRRA